jgi:chitinase
LRPNSYFSLAVATEQNRQTFANNILTVYNQYNLDGIDM